MLVVDDEDPAEAGCVLATTLFSPSGACASAALRAQLVVRTAASLGQVAVSTLALAEARTASLRTADGIGV